MTPKMNTLRLFEISLPTRAPVWHHIPGGTQRKFLVKGIASLVGQVRIGHQMMTHLQLIEATEVANLPLELT